MLLRNELQMINKYIHAKISNFDHFENLLYIKSGSMPLTDTVFMYERKHEIYQCFVCIFSDIDECLPGSIVACPTNTSYCENTGGSYQCICKAGYRDDTGDGTECSSKCC